MAKNKKQSTSNARIDYFTSIIDDMVYNHIDDDALDAVYDYLKENGMRFKLPTQLSEHNISNLYTCLNFTDKMRTRYPSKNDLKELLRIVADGAVFGSDWYNGLSENGCTECEGPCLVRFNPEQKYIQFYYISPIFLWTYDIDNNKSEFDNKTAMMNEFIVSDTVEFMAKWSATNGDFGFNLSEKYDNVYERVNVAIEQIVDKIELKEIGGLWYNGGLILVNSGQQIWFIFSPLCFTMSADLDDMPSYHTKEELDKWGLS